MMATYRLCVVCVLLCIVCLVHSTKIWGGIRENANDPASKSELTESINGFNADNIKYLTLYRFVDPGNLQTLTLINFKSLRRLEIMNIALETVPIFENTSIQSIRITGNQIKSLPANAFNAPRPQHINLTNNQIEDISDSAMNIGVGNVVLACNKLTSFSQAWFQKPSGIWSLILAGNQIEYIQQQAFSQMTELRTLELSNNRIARIDSEAFSAEIRHLYLNFNNIGQLTLDMFESRDKPMRSLYIHHNKLNYLTETLFMKLKPASVMLDGNPWQCQCLRDIERWLRELNSTRIYLTFRRDDPACVVPTSFETKCVHGVDKKSEQLYMEQLSPVPNCAIPCGRCSIEGLSTVLLSFQYANNKHL